MKIPTEIAAGLLFIGVGGGFALVAANYRLGTAANMGPGYFPFAVGMILAGIGIVLLLNAVRLKSSERPVLGAWDVRGLFVVLFSVALFGLLIEAAGLFITLLLVVLAASFANRDVSWKAALLCAVVVPAVSLTIFRYGLGLQLPPWPTMIGG